MSLRLRIGARPSALALAQAALIETQLRTIVAGLDTEVIAIRTSGDRLTSAALAQVGGKGLFVRELEQALSAGTIDVAVHSMKDLPAVLPAAYQIAAVPPREDARDLLITRAPGGWEALARGARLGTASARRRCEALRVRPDLEVGLLRGNIDTRLRRLDQGEFDAIILARAGLKRLARLDHLHLLELDEDAFVPSAGQGALALETLAASPPGLAAELVAAIAHLDDSRARAETTGERAFLAAIGASCASPIGVKGTLSGDTLHLRALVFSLDGSHSLRDELTGPRAEAARLGVALAEQMMARGAAALIRDER
ncbi:MAG TPA: hydroxymethylbilane synthase [Candidatus Binataceae bacterium]|nr:hydroxymethylbilane synthase [Candidatus Binataceae bacterium]